MTSVGIVTSIAEAAAQHPAFQGAWEPYGVAAAAGAVAGIVTIRFLQSLRRRAQEAREAARERHAARSRVVTSVRIHAEWRRPIYLAPPRAFIDRVGAN